MWKLAIRARQQAQEAEDELHRQRRQDQEALRQRVIAGEAKSEEVTRSLVQHLFPLEQPNREHREYSIYGPFSVAQREHFETQVQRATPPQVIIRREPPHLVEVYGSLQQPESFEHFNFSSRY